MNPQTEFYSCSKRIQLPTFLQIHGGLFYFNCSLFGKLSDESVVNFSDAEIFVPGEFDYPVFPVETYEIGEIDDSFGPNSIHHLVNFDEADQGNWFMDGITPRLVAMDKSTQKLVAVSLDLEISTPKKEVRLIRKVSISTTHINQQPVNGVKPDRSRSAQIGGAIQA